VATFGGWCQDQQIAERLLPLHIGAAFEVIVSRIDTARAAGSADPMRTVSTSLAGPNSRAITHRMLASLGYSPAQRRVVHRLLSGSASGWPGLLMLFATGASLTTTHRRYVLRQIRYFGAGPTRTSSTG
jgi:hypothetical protein